MTYKPGENATFTEQKTSNLDYNTDTPKGPEITCKPGYIAGTWSPTVAEKVTADATYVAGCTADKETA